MNPCPCGYSGDASRSCSCREHRREAYRSKLSGPFVDRMDLGVTHVRLGLRARTDGSAQRVRPSAKHPIRVRRHAARRAAMGNWNHERFCGRWTIQKQRADLTADARSELGEVIEGVALTGRGVDRLLQGSRTVGDLSGDSKGECEASGCCSGVPIAECRRSGCTRHEASSPIPDHQPLNPRIIAPGSNEWRQGLDELGPHTPPKKLFLAGRDIDPGARTVAVVGTRRPTAAGIEAAQMIAKGLAQAGFVVVSGLAIGVDAAAHRASLEAKGHTIAVIGSGMDLNYPKKQRCLAEEDRRRGNDRDSSTQNGAPPLQHHFPLRNRIIVGSIGGGGRRGGIDQERSLDFREDRPRRKPARFRCAGQHSESLCRRTKRANQMPGSDSDNGCPTHLR